MCFYSWSRITKYICSSSTPNLLSVLDPTSLVRKLTSFRFTKRTNLPQGRFVSRFVPGAGIEPARPCGHKILSLAWLPITPSGHTYYSIRNNSCTGGSRPAFSNSLTLIRTLVAAHSSRLYEKPRHRSAVRLPAYCAQAQYSRTRVWQKPNP